jgi:hypothetical protein
MQNNNDSDFDFNIQAFSFRKNEDTANLNPENNTVEKIPAFDEQLFLE